MSYDIWGNPLPRGHCEVHPHVHEEYPCSVCMAEKRSREQASQQSEAEHYLQVEIDRLKAERDDLLAALDGLVDCYCSVSPDLTRDERINHRRTLSKAQILILEIRKNKGGAA